MKDTEFTLWVAGGRPPTHLPSVKVHSLSVTLLKGIKTPVVGPQQKPASEMNWKPIRGTERGANSDQGELNWGAPDRERVQGRTQWLRGTDLALLPGRDPTLGPDAATAPRRGSTLGPSACPQDALRGSLAWWRRGGGWKGASG